MPAGGPHGRLISQIMAVLDDRLENQQLMLLPDTFMLYRDENGIKQRLAPDLLLMPWRAEVPTTYDLEVEPPPLFVAEVTSQKSHVNDLEKKVSFYQRLGISTYLVIDAVTPRNQPRKLIQLHLWRVVNGTPVKQSPDAAGRFWLPELGVRLHALGRRLIFVNADTGEELYDGKQWRVAFQTQAQRAQVAVQRAKAEAQRADAEAQRAVAEATARQAAETEVARLTALLAKTS